MRSIDFITKCITFEVKKVDFSYKAKEFAIEDVSLDMSVNHTIHVFISGLVLNIFI